MSRWTGRRDMTEKLLKTALNPNQSINQPYEKIVDSQVCSVNICQVISLESIGQVSTSKAWKADVNFAAVASTHIDLMTSYHNNRSSQINLFASQLNGWIGCLQNCSVWLGEITHISKRDKEKVMIKCFKKIVFLVSIYFGISLDTITTT